MESAGSGLASTGEEPVETIYKEQTLDLSKRQIRILQLYPGAPKQPIQCALETAYLDENPRYEALSYAWVNPNVSVPIRVNGHRHFVTTNLAAALERLRKPSAAPSLWVDALCIDQGDSAEKSHQVNLMRDIYSNAAHGLLWLGDFTAKEIGQLPHLAALSVSRDGMDGTKKDATSSASGPPTRWYAPPAEDQAAGERPSTIPRLSAVRAFTLIQLLAAGRPLPLGGPTALDLGELMGLSWWHRIWSVQEAVLPRSATFICGSLNLPRDAVITAGFRVLGSGTDPPLSPGMPAAEAEALWRFLHEAGVLRESMESLRDEHLSSSVSATTTALFGRFRHRSASDRRDKIFALLGLFQHPAFAQLARSADYSLTWRQAYQRAMASIVRATESLLPLLWRSLRGGPMGSTDAELPSWVPDWSQSITAPMMALHMGLDSDYAMYNSSGPVPLVLRDGCPEEELTMMGSMVDTVLRTGPTTLWGGSEAPRAHCGSRVRQWEKLLKETSLWEMTYPGGGTYREAFLRLLHGDVRLKGPLRPAVGIRRAQRSDYEAMMSDWMDRGPRLHMNGATFFLTKRGYIGLGTYHLQVEDSVHILFGGRVPFVLRARHDVGHHCYSYVGHAYVHGFMDGEALEGGAIGTWTTLV